MPGKIFRFLHEEVRDDSPIVVQVYKAKCCGKGLAHCRQTWCFVFILQISVWLASDNPDVL